jgi:CBS domain-containing protein
VVERCSAPDRPAALRFQATMLDQALDDLLFTIADELDSLTAGEVASTDLVTISSNESLERAARLMSEHGVTHLIAVQPDTGQPAGMISARTIAAALAYGGS